MTDASVSAELTRTDSSLTIVPNYTFTEGSGYCITFDRGIVKSVDPRSAAQCQIVSQWANIKQHFMEFEVTDLKPGKNAYSHEAHHII